MSVFVVIPVKTLLKAKMRLSTVLSLQERQAFTLAMLEDVLGAVKRSKIHQIVVISADSAVQRFAHNFGVTALQEKTYGLNEAAEQATQWCIRKNAESVLILPADIPLLKPEDVNEIIRLSSENPCIVVSPSRNEGTNALLRKPPNVVSLRFGTDSFRKHLAEASARNVPSKVYFSNRVSLDIDSIEDVERLLQIKENTASHQLLKKIGIEMRLKSLIKQ
jgi:2-phospho-L-lactate guanylyltransferase